MVELLSPVSTFGWAIGIADADRIGASAKVQAANPINKSRFMCGCSLGRVIAMIDNASAHALFPWMEQILLSLTRTQNGPARTGAPRPLVSELPTGMAWGQAGPVEVLALHISSGCLFGAICLGLSRALWLVRLRSISHGLGQHLAQLGFGLLRCAGRSRLRHIMAHNTVNGNAGA
jgi:hypothetical protein